MFYLKWPKKYTQYLFSHLKIASRIVIENHYSCSVVLNKSVSVSLNQQRCCHCGEAPWSVLFFGTGSFALKSLRQLHNHLSSKLLSRLEVVTSCNTPQKNDVIIFAEENNIKVHSWPITFPISRFDIGIVVSFGHLIPSWIIKSFPLGMINVHASLLPRWRGAAPVIFSLIHGDTTTGITIMKIMPHKFDTGEILAQISIDVHPDETHPQLYDRLGNIGSELLIKTITQLPNIIDAGIPQSNENVTYAPKITEKISLVHWNKMTTVDVYNLQRALTTLYPLTTYLDGQKIKLFDVKCCYKPLFNSSQIIPGLVLHDKKQDLITVQCKDGGWVSIQQLSMAQYRKMTANDFYNGFMSNFTEQQIIFTNKNNTD